MATSTILVEALLKLEEKIIRFEEARLGQLLVS
jgi:hypothetical protein